MVKFGGETDEYRTVQFAQISVALYMGTVALMTIANAVPPDSRWAVLAFSGIGITAASVISEKGKLKNYMALAGSGIALLGAFVEMDRTLATGDGDATAVTVLLAAGFVIYVPFTAMALHWSQWGRILIAPLLVAGLVFSVTLVSTGVPAVLISIECNPEPVVHSNADISLRFDLRRGGSCNALYNHSVGIPPSEERSKSGYQEGQRVMGWLYVASEGTTRYIHRPFHVNPF